MIFSQRSFNVKLETSTDRRCLQNLVFIHSKGPSSHLPFPLAIFVRTSACIRSQLLYVENSPQKWIIYRKGEKGRQNAKANIDKDLRTIHSFDKHKFPTCLLLYRYEWFFICCFCPLPFISLELTAIKAMLLRCIEVKAIDACYRPAHLPLAWCCFCVSHQLATKNTLRHRTKQLWWLFKLYSIAE